MLSSLGLVNAFVSLDRLISKKNCPWQILCQGQFFLLIKYSHTRLRYFFFLFDFVRSLGMQFCIVIIVAADVRSYFQFALSNISHPLEGTFYLILLGFFLRWRWPRTWNNLLEKASAKIDHNASQEVDSKSWRMTSFFPLACFNSKTLLFRRRVLEYELKFVLGI